MGTHVLYTCGYTPASSKQRCNRHARQQKDNHFSMASSDKCDSGNVACVSCSSLTKTKEEHRSTVIKETLLSMKVTTTVVTFSESNDRWVSVVGFLIVQW